MTASESLPPWLSDCWQQLLHYQHNQRIPHAILLYGSAGTGKRLLAERYAQALLCQKPRENGEGCGQCQSCLLFHAGTHPDFLLLEPEQAGKPIPVASVRELSEKLALTPQYGGYRPVLMAPAHALNLAAANALLKTLEEPAPGTVMLLLSDRPSALPATIRSRCQKLRLPLPAPAMALDWLRQQGQDEEAASLLALANGAPLQALRLASAGTLGRQNAVMDDFLGVLEGTKIPLAAAGQWLEGPPGEEILTWLSGCIIDMIRLQHHPDTDSLYNPVLRTRLQTAAQALNLKKLFHLLDRLLTGRQLLLESQINPQLLFEELLIEWANLGAPARHRNRTSRYG